MGTLRSSGRAALLVATGLLLGALGTPWVGALAQTVPQATTHQTNMTSGHQMGGGSTGMSGHQMGGGAPMMTMDVDRHFIEWMIPHHEDAVSMTALAASQAEHSEIKTLAAHINQTQSAEIDQMRQWYGSWYGTEVATDTMAAGMMGRSGSHDGTPLDGAKPFDKAFIEQMIPHHEMAVMGSTMALRHGAVNPELRDLLQSIITSQTAEIAQMREWYQQWYGVPVPQTSAMGSHGTMGAGSPMGMGGHQMGTR